MTDTSHAIMSKTVICRTSTFSVTEKESSISIIVNVTRRKLGWVSHWKVQNSRWYETAGWLQNRSGWLSRQCHRLGKFPAEAFGLSRTMQTVSCQGKLWSRCAYKIASVLRQPMDKSMCADIAKSRTRGYREEVEVPLETFHRVDEKFIRLYATHFPRLSQHFVLVLKVQRLFKLLSL